MQPPTKKNLKLSTAICFLSIFSLGLTICSLGPSLNVLLNNTGQNIVASKFIIFIKPLGFFLGIYLGEKILKRCKENIILGFCFLGVFISLLIIPQLRDFTLLLSLLFVMGSIEGIMEMVTNSYLVILHKKKVAPFMNMMHFFFGTGAILAPSIVGWNIEHSDSIEIAYYIFALFFLLGGSSFFISFQKEPEKQDKTKKISGHTIVVFFISLVFFFYVGLESVYLVWIFNYSMDVVNFGPQEAGYINSLFWIGFTASRLVCTFLTTRLSNQFILVLLLMISFSGISLFYYFYNNSLWLPMISFTLGFSFGGIFPLLLSYMEEKLGLTPLILRSFLFFSGLGAIVFPTALEPLYRINEKFFLHTLLFCLLFIVFFLSMSYEKLKTIPIKNEDAT